MALPYHFWLLDQCSVVQLLLPSYVPTVEQFCSTKVVSIPNIVPLVLEKKHDKRDKYSVCMVARLCKDKQQHLLVEAFAKIAQKYPDWEVHFYGAEYTKNYHLRLEKLIRQYQLEQQVFLRGTTTQVYEVLRKSDIFAFPSLYEGFPLALTEAMSVGLPCVGFKTSPGVNELIVDGVTEFLTENNVDDFAQKLQILMRDHQLRQTMGQAGREAMKQYAPEAIWDEWEKLIFDTVDSHRVPSRKPIIGISSESDTPLRKAG